MKENKILFPYNFKEMDNKTLEFVIQIYGGHENVKITVFHAYAPIPEIITDKNSVMGNMSANLHYLRQNLIEQENRMKEVRQHFLDQGFHSSQVNYSYLPKKRDLAMEILALARDEAYQTIVLNRSGSVTGFFKASVFNKVVTSLKNVNILIIT